MTKCPLKLELRGYQAAWDNLFPQEQTTAWAEPAQVYSNCIESFDTIYISSELSEQNKLQCLSQEGIQLKRSGLD